MKLFCNLLKIAAVLLLLPGFFCKLKPMVEEPPQFIKEISPKEVLYRKTVNLCRETLAKIQNRRKVHEEIAKEISKEVVDDFKEFFKRFSFGFERFEQTEKESKEELKEISNIVKIAFDEACFIKFAQYLKDEKKEKIAILRKQLSPSLYTQVLEEYYCRFKENYRVEKLEEFLKKYLKDKKILTKDGKTLDFTKKLNVMRLMQKGFLPILSKLPGVDPIESLDVNEEDIYLEKHYSYYRKLLANADDEYAKEYAKHTDLNIFFDDIPYCLFKNLLVKEIHNYAQWVLQQDNKQELFNKTPEGILKVAIRLISRPGQIRFNTNIIDLTKIKEMIKQAKDINNLYLERITIRDQNSITHQKLKNYIIALLPILCPNLQILNLFFNDLKFLPKEIGNLSNLQELHLSENKLEFLPKEIGNLSNLQMLNISKNKLTSLPPEIGNLSSLQNLSLSNNELKFLPKEIGNLSNLLGLWLEKNKLTSLSPEIENLSNLQRLYISENELESLPKEIGNLSNLQMLNIYKNKLEFLPKEIGNLSNLQMLNIYKNKLTSLPPEIGNLSSLQDLYISKNKLKFLPKEIGNLSNLQMLNIYKNKLTSLPKEIGNLSSLQTLSLSNNELKSLPKEIGNLSNLQILYISENELESLPKEIGNLSSLQNLSLSNNELKFLPKEIGKLSNLLGLWLENNKLTSFPPEIGNLKKLEILIIDKELYEKIKDELPDKLKKIVEKTL
ncbi:leucine-rich repeat domain-containing protein [Candidatus Babeliales bacterium]|nr:leucine-rich repeat domain-containing protein [Candidatus Babeliales bacterium]